MQWCNRPGGQGEECPPHPPPPRDFSPGNFCLPTGKIDKEKSEKGGNGEEKKENCKREGGKLKMEGTKVINEVGRKVLNEMRGANEPLHVFTVTFCFQVYIPSTSLCHFQLLGKSNVSFRQNEHSPFTQTCSSGTFSKAMPENL